MESTILKYEVIIFWSDEDDAFVAMAPELEGCSAFGDTYEDALREMREAMMLWLDTAREFGDRIPEPKGHQLMVA
jgi:predicted RNase H-like HicB family nuclease